MKDKFKRVNVLIKPEQYEQISSSGLSISGLVRDLLDDRFNESKVVLSVSPETHRLYNHVISNFGIGDLELESYILRALDEFLGHKESEIEELRRKLQPSEDK